MVVGGSGRFLPPAFWTEDDSDEDTALLSLASLRREAWALARRASSSVPDLLPLDDPELEDRLDTACWKRLFWRTMLWGIRRSEVATPFRASSRVKKSSRLICIHRGLREPMLSAMMAMLAQSLMRESMSLEIRHSCIIRNEKNELEGVGKDVCFQIDMTQAIVTECYS